MQKIIIKNFGAIKEAEIDIPKTLILIGEQASGKSTIAKLVYFFQGLRYDYFDDFLNSEGDVDFHSLVSDKFYDFFGTVEQESIFELIFYFNLKERKAIKIYSNKESNIFVEISRDFITSASISILDKAFNQLFLNREKLLRKVTKEEKSLIEKENEIILNNCISYLKNDFNLWYNENLYIVAGRNATVQYNDLFEKLLFAEVKNFASEYHSPIRSSIKEQTINEHLTLLFMENVSRVKTIFERNGGTFASLLKSQNKNGILTKAENKISEILKGKYSSDKLGEKINLENGRSVRLSNASSGQQEAIRILQDLFLVILQNQKVLRIVEEPEAHLFPVAQKQMIELLALMVNQNVENSLIVTTHSPYILSTFNNLLFANRVVEKNPDAESEVAEIVDIDFRLKAADFAAYTLRNTEGGFVSESIMSDRGVIKQNYLDTVSEMLGYEFNNLRLIHTKTFARK